MSNNTGLMDDSGNGGGSGNHGDNNDLNNNNAGGSNSQKKRQHADGSAVLLSFPTTYTDPIPYLAPLRDNHSNYIAVAKTCLLLNQFAANGSCATIEDNTCIDTSSIYHDISFVSSISESFTALLDCIGQHDDRRARILACKTAAIISRASYARLRHTPHLFSMRETATNHRLEDEIGTDVPMALCTVALEDPDDGVAASAMSSLGILVLSTSSTPGTLVDDELLSEVMSIVNAGSQPSSYAPTLRALVDEDIKTSQTELQCRIFDNILSPRLLQLVSRFQAFDDPTHLAMVIPTLTASLVYLSKVAPPMIHPLNQATYSKRWVELDYVSLIDSVVEGLLLPIMKSNTGIASGGNQAGHVAALSAIRLAHACPTSCWTQKVIQWSIMVLKEECDATTCVETRMVLLACLLVASRALPIRERNATVFEFIVDSLQELPSTIMVPNGIVSAGLLLEYGIVGNGKVGRSGSTGNGVMAQFRKPTRPSYWAELALSIFMDGPVETSSSEQIRERSQVLTDFLKSPSISSILKDSNAVEDDKRKVREEMLLAFCMVAFQVGRRHKCPEDGGGPHLYARKDELEEWVEMSLTVLKAFGACLSWGDSPSFMEEEMTMTVACQAGYTQLVQEVLHGAGLLGPTSVSFKMTPFSSPPNILWDQMEQSAEFFVQFESMSPMDSMLEPIGKLLDDIVKKELKGQGIMSHHMRLFLLSLASDQWVHARYIASQRYMSDGGTTNLSMDVDSAKQILFALSPRRMFSKVVESNKSEVENYSKSKKEKYKKFAQDMVTTCVACIENMALITCDYAKRFGTNNDTKAILNFSVQSLQGKSGAESDASVLPVCQGAIERIQAAFQSNSRGNKEFQSVSSLVPADFNRRQLVSSSRINQGREAFNEGYIMQLSRQIVASRADRCILSFPPVSSFPSGIRRQNWLRISYPPLPHGRNSQVATERIPRFAWQSNVSICTGGSDPVAVTMAYSMRRSMRYDGAEEYRLVISIRLHNLAAAEIPNGLRLELGISEESVSTSEDSQDTISFEIAKSLAEGFEDTTRESAFTSAVAVYRNELKGGEHITWALVMNTMPMTGAITLKPTIVFRALEKEPPHAAWVTADLKKEDEDTSVTSGYSQRSGGSKADSENGKPGKEQMENITITGKPVTLSPMIGLHPCPFVFHRDGTGDIDTFRFLWSRMPCQLTPLKLVPISESEEMPMLSYDAMRLASISTVAFEGDSVSGGMITHLWAFMNPHGKRVMFVLAEQGADSSKTLHIRGDDKQLLLCLTGTSTARDATVSALQLGLKAFHQEIFN